MKKLILLVTMILFLVTGCQVNNLTQETTITHKLGETSVRVHPEKVVVFDMGVVDILDGAKVKIGGLPKSNLPTALAKYKDDAYLDAGTLFEPNYDALAKYKPDLIIISARAAKAYDSLREIAPTIYIGTDTSTDGLMASIGLNLKTLSQIYPDADFSTGMNTLEKSVSLVKEKAQASHAKTMFLLANGDTISSFGPKSRYDHVFNEFGFEPLDEAFQVATHGDKLSLEHVAKLNPEMLIIMDRGAITKNSTLATDLLKNEFIQMTKAYQNQKILFVDPQTWYLTEGGIHSLNEASKELLSLFNGVSKP